MQYCTFCAAPIETKCPYEGLCFAGLHGQPITTVPKLGFTDPTIARKKAERIAAAKKANKEKEMFSRWTNDVKCTAYDIYGEKIADFRSFNDAAEKLGIDISVVNFNVNAKRKNGITECGHAFRKIGAKKRECKIIVRLEDGKETGRWPTVAACARAVGKLKGWIYNQCEGLSRNRFNDPVRYQYKIIHI